MEVIGVAADTAPSNGKGVRYGALGRGGVTAMVVEVLLGVGRFDVDRGAEMEIKSQLLFISPYNFFESFISCYKWRNNTDG